jgi:hypothetical protein
MGGADLEKTWYATEDKVTRPWHSDVDGTSVALDEPFEVDGEYLMYPLDDSLGATASNIYNCRCTTYYQLVDAVKRHRSRKEWDESLHPRDANGRFGDGGGGDSGSNPPGVSAFDAGKVYTDQSLRDARSKASELTGAYSDSQDRAILKAQVAHDLATRLADTPGWDDYVMRTQFNSEGEKYSSGDPNDSAASGLVALWALTSGDHNDAAVTMQMAAQKEFGLDAATGHFSGTQTLVSEGPYAQNMPVYQAFVRAQYDSTQAYLSSQGVTSVPLFRGVALDNASPGVQDTTVDLQPMSSFSSDTWTAVDFANSSTSTDSSYRVGMYTNVDAAQILSTPRTGFGCANESEFVVLGAKGVPVRTTAVPGNGRMLQASDLTNLAEGIVPHEP